MNQYNNLPVRSFRDADHLEKYFIEKLNIPKRNRFQKDS